MYSLLLAIIYLAFLSLGLPDSLLGAGWPAMRVDLGADLALAGVISIIITVNTIISSVLSDRLTRRFGTGTVTAVSVAVSAAALLGFSVANRFWILCVLSVPYGLAAGGVDAALNNYVAQHYSAGQMSWLHCFWGLGALISPYVMSYCLTSGLGWNSGYRIVFFAQAAIAVTVIASLPLWKKLDKRYADTLPPTAKKALSIREIIRIPGAIPLFVAFFAYCAAEQTAMIWASTYLVEYHGVTADVAAGYASFVFIGITAGRALCGFVATKIGDKLLIRLGIGVMVLSAIVIALSPLNATLALVGLIAFGVGCAPVYPSIIHATPTNFGSDKASALIGIQMACAYTGVTVMPPVFGLIARSHVATFPYYLLALSILLIVFTEMVNRITAQHAPLSDTQ